MTFEMVKRNYDRKLWNAAMVAIAVVKGVITEVQYTEITGEPYAAPASVPKTTAQTVAEHEESLNELAGV